MTAPQIVDIDGPLKLNRFAVLLAMLVLSTGAAASESADDAKRGYELFVLAEKNQPSPGTRPLAIQQITAAIRLDPNNATYHYHKGLYLAVSEEDDDEALRCLTKALSLDPKLHDAWNTKAVLLLRNKQLESALLCANKAIAMKPGYYSLTRLRILQRMNRLPQALKEAAESTRKHPADESILTMHADLSQQLGHWQTVIADETKLLKIVNPKKHKYLQHLKNRAKAYVETNQDEKAIIDLETAAKTTTIDRQVHSDLLNIYKRTKDLNNIAKEEAYIKKMDEDMLR